MDALFWLDAPESSVALGPDIEKREQTMNYEVHGELQPAGGGDAIPLIREVLTIGRRDSCDIPLRFPNISGIHAQLQFRNGYWYIRDLNSTNGVKVQGIRIQAS